MIARASRFTALTQKAAASSSLASMRWDGTDIRQVVRVTGFVNPTEGGGGGGGTPASEILMAPEGDRAIALVGNNVYLVTCRATGKQLLVDAADDAHRCLGLVREGTGRLDHLVTTHRHWDHVRALEEVARVTGATTYAGADDADGLPVAPDVRLRHGDVVTVESIGQVVRVLPFFPSITVSASASATVERFEPQGSP